MFVLGILLPVKNLTEKHVICPSSICLTDTWILSYTAGCILKLTSNVSISRRLFAIYCSMIDILHGIICWVILFTT